VISANLPRVMIAGCRSGSGKTSAACGIMRAFGSRGLRVQGFKCGPDYIDPMYHDRACGAGRASRNLDMFMCSEAAVGYLFGSNAAGADISVIEGVMGLYDGLSGGGECSSNAVARATGTPAILVFDPTGMGLSAAAVLYGFTAFRENAVKGVIFNNTPEKMYGFYRDLIQRELGVRAFGHLPRMPEAGFPDRHLGLVTPAEVDGIQARLDILGRQCERTLDMDGILELARGSPVFSYDDAISNDIKRIGDVRVAIARDAAFCFYYADNLALLERLGARLIPFSPLADERLPDDVHGLILPGGYPEEHAARLSKNAAMLGNVRAALTNGLPCVAECGGFMYLTNSLTDRDGIAHGMAGFIGADCAVTGGLKRFGYVTLTANRDNMLCAKGGSINAHEFHYSECGGADSAGYGRGFTASKRDGRSWDCVYASPSLYAGYPHLHLWGNIDFARNFVMCCNRYKEGGRC